MIFLCVLAVIAWSLNYKLQRYTALPKWQKDLLRSMSKEEKRLFWRNKDSELFAAEKQRREQLEKSVAERMYRVEKD